MTDQICVGAIAGAFGVKGDVRLKSFTSDPEDIATYGPLTTEDGARAFEVRVIGQSKNALIATLSGVRTKEQADDLRATKLFVPRDRMPSLPDDEYYHADLIGLAVFDTGGQPLGHVKSVMNHGASDLLEIHGPGLRTTVLLPFTQAAVPTVDLNNRRIVADPPDGIFPE